MRHFLLSFLAASVCVAATAASAATGPVTTASGLVYQSLKEGSGASPGSHRHRARCTTAARFTDGKEFDSSYKRGEPTEFPLNGVIPCWTEGVQMMKPGGKAQAHLPGRRSPMASAAPAA